MKKLIVLILSFCIVLCGCASSSVETTASTEEAREDDYAAIKQFISLYNTLYGEAFGDTITDIEPMDFDGEDNRRSYKAYQHAVGMKGVISDGIIEIVNHGNFKNDKIRVLAYVSSLEAATSLYAKVVLVFDNSLTSEAISSSIRQQYPDTYYFLLGEDSEISGFLKINGDEPSIQGYEVLIDCDNISFANINSAQ